MNGWRFLLPLSWHRGSLLPLLFGSQSKGGRLGIPASVASKLSSSYVYRSTLKAKSSEYLSIHKGLRHWRARITEIVPVSGFACGWGWSKSSGAGVQGQPSHQNRVYGAQLPCIPSCSGMGLLLVPLLHAHHTSATGLICRGAAQQHRATQQSLNFLCCRMKPIHAEGWICPFMHREKHSFLLLSLIKHLPPKPLGCSIYIHFSRQSFIPWVSSLSFSPLHWENASLKIFSQEKRCVTKRQACVHSFPAFQLDHCSQSGPIW